MTVSLSVDVSAALSAFPVLCEVFAWNTGTTGKHAAYLITKLNYSQPEI